MRVPAPAIPSPRACGALLLTALAAVLCAGVLLPPAAQASFEHPKSQRQLAQRAGVILIGRVRAVTATPSFVEEAMAAGALLASAVFVLRRGRIPPRDAARESLAAFLAVFLAGSMVSRRVWYRSYRYIAEVEVDRWVAGSTFEGETIAVPFKYDFPCDETDLQAGERYLLFLGRKGPGYIPCWFHHGACKETAEGFRPSSSLAGNWPCDEDALVEEIQRFR
jgi:hypothetical protein